MLYIIKNTNLNRIWRVYLDILNFLVWYLAVMRFRNSCVSVTVVFGFS